MMETVTTQGSLRNAINIPGYRIAAKSGTAQVAENGKYGGDYTVSVAGLIPADKPQYAVIVTLVQAADEQDLGGGSPGVRDPHEAGHQDLPHPAVDHSRAERPGILVAPATAGEQAAAPHSEKQEAGTA